MTYQSALSIIYLSVKILFGDGSITQMVQEKQELKASLLDFH